MTKVFRKGKAAFKVLSAETTFRELAAVHEKIYGTKVDISHEGSLEDLEIKLAKMRKETARAR
jgi:hypothetical protein